MNLFQLTGEVLLRGTDEAQRDLTQVTNTAEGSSSKIQSALKKIGGVIATAFAVDKIKDFGVAAVNAAASVAAEASAFEQIMGNYSDKALEKLSTVADATGMMDSRLKPYMTSLTAKFKGLGNGIEESTSYATRGLTLAADASAFWDKSLDDAMSGLNSFINGSYEGGEAIGLFANDTQLAQFAIKKGLVETTAQWSALDEATKQATRLEYAENMMKASGATGQAAKEAGQYANVVAELKETWRQFLATVGEPLLQNVVIPVIRTLQSMLAVLTDKFRAVQEWVEKNRETFDKLKALLLIVTSATAAYLLVLGGMYIVQNITGWITKLGGAFIKLGVAMLANPIALIAALIVGLGVALVYLWNTNEEARDKITGAWNAIKTAVEPVVTWLKSVWEELERLWVHIKDDVILPFVADVVARWEEFKTQMEPIIERIKTALQPLVDVFNILKDTVVTMWNENIAPIFDQFGAGADDLSTESNVALTGVQMAFDTVFKVIDGILSGFVWFFENILAPLIEGVSQFVTDNIDPIKGIVEGVMTAVQGIIQTFTSLIKGDWEGVWEGIKTFFSGIWDAIKDLATVALEALKAIIHWDEIKTAIVNAWESIKTAISDKWNEIKTSITDWITKVKTAISDKFEEIKAKIKDIWDSIIGIFKKKDGKDKGAEVGDGFKEGVESKESGLQTAGGNLVAGLKKGIENAKSTITNVANKVYGWFESTFKKTAEIESPSKKTMTLGEFMGLGIADGITLANGEVISAAEAMERGIEDVFVVMGDNGEVLGASVSEAIADGIVAQNTTVENSANTILDTIKDALGGAEDTFAGVLDKLKGNKTVQDAAKMLGFDVSSWISEGVEEGSEDITTAVTVAGETAKKSWLTKVKEWYEGSKSALQGTAKKISETFDSAVSFASSYIAPIGDAINAYQDQVLQNEINSLQSSYDALQEKNDAELDAEQEKYDAELAMLNDQLDAKAISDEEYNTKKKQLDADQAKFKEQKLAEEAKAEKDLLKKKDELARKQFEANKKTQLANVWINAASGIARAWAENFWPVALGISAAIGTAAGVQTAAINEQQYTPMLAKGGVVDGATNAIIGENGREAVVPLENNIEWVNGLAKAMTPALGVQNVDYRPEIHSIKEQMTRTYDMLVDKLNQIIGRNPQIVLDTGTLVGAIAPRMDSSLGNINRLRGRGM